MPMISKVYFEDYSEFLMLKLSEIRYRVQIGSLPCQMLSLWAQ